jgi:recombinase/resolvase-like protein
MMWTVSPGLGIVKRDLERHGVQVIFRKLPTDSSPTQNLMINVLGSFAEFERELIADRTRRGRRYKVEVRKQFVGAIPPYGFRYLRRDPAANVDGDLQLDPNECAVVRQMYTWVDREGLSARRVVDRLNRLGVRPRKGGLQWGKSSVVRILRSETYAGLWHFGKNEGCQPVNPKKSDRGRRRFHAHCDLLHPSRRRRVSRVGWPVLRRPRPDEGNAAIGQAPS